RAPADGRGRRRRRGLRRPSDALAAAAAEVPGEIEPDVDRKVGAAPGDPDDPEVEVAAEAPALAELAEHRRAGEQPPGEGGVVEAIAGEPVAVAAASDRGAAAEAQRQQADDPRRAGADQQVALGAEVMHPEPVAIQPRDLGVAQAAIVEPRAAADVAALTGAEPLRGVKADPEVSAVEGAGERR